jgi:hypothetical protein
MITWQDSYQKTQRLTRDPSAGTLTQLKQDMNTGYHLFNAKLARYYTRKQQFTNLIAQQGIYQTPVDCVRVTGMTVLVSNTYQPPVKEVRNEYQWRQITSYNQNSNWPAWYFMIGNDEVSLWPIPSQTVTNGLRYYYQPADHDLTIDDVTSISTGATVTVTNGSATITASSGIFTTDQTSLYFQVTGEVDNTAYEIVASTSTTLTLKSAYVGSSGSGKAWRVGQLGILPKQYVDAPMHYALGNYFSAQGNEERSQFHLGTEESPGMFYKMQHDCEQEYSSAMSSNVISEDDLYLNTWLLPPTPSLNS